LELTDRNIAAFADTLERVESRYREGLVPALDVYQSRQNLAAARSRRPEFEKALAAAEHALAVLLGRYPGRGIVEKDRELPPAVPDFPAGLPSELLARRPDVQAGLLRLQASDARIAAAIADCFPALRLTGSYGGQSTELADLLASGNIFWNLLLNIAQPLFDGGRRAAEVDRSRAVFRENLAAYHQSVLAAFREVEDALTAGRTVQERIARLGEREEASAAALRLALDRYLQGLSDFLPVLTAQGLHFDAQSQLLAARRQFIADRITLARALGGVWMEQELAKGVNPAAP
jgi:NodT family efflux transporter outer membrane factor (OMF) lipoprotein